MKALEVARILVSCSLLGSISSTAVAVTCTGTPRNWPATSNLDSFNTTCLTTKGTLAAQTNSDGKKITAAKLTAGTTPGASAFTLGLRADGTTGIASCQAVDVLPVDGTPAKNTGSCQDAVKWRGSLKT